MPADIARRYWPLWLLAACLLVITAAFGTYLTDRQREANRQHERERAAICAILANIPGHVPYAIERARRVFARRAGECQPITRHSPRPQASAHPQVERPAATVIVQPSRQPTPSPTPTRTRTPRPKPSHTPTPRPSPSPSPTCSLNELIHDPAHCLVTSRLDPSRKGHDERRRPSTVQVFAVPSWPLPRLYVAVTAYRLFLRL